MRWLLQDISTWLPRMDNLVELHLDVCFVSSFSGEILSKFRPNYVGRLRICNTWSPPNDCTNTSGPKQSRIIYNRALVFAHRLRHPYVPLLPSLSQRSQTRVLPSAPSAHVPTHFTEPGVAYCIRPIWNTHCSRANAFLSVDPPFHGCRTKIERTHYPC